MDVQVRFRQTKAFSQDLALFSISDRRIALLRRNLTTNPFLGRPDKGSPRLFRYEMGNHVVTYSVNEDGLADNEIIVWLLTLRPADRPRANLTKRAAKVLDTYLKIKSAIGGLFSDDD